MIVPNFHTSCVQYLFCFSDAQMKAAKTGKNCSQFFSAETLNLFYLCRIMVLQSKVLQREMQQSLEMQTMFEHIKKNLKSLKKSKVYKHN